MYEAREHKQAVSRVIGKHQGYNNTVLFKVSDNKSETHKYDIIQKTTADATVIIDLGDQKNISKSANGCSSTAREGVEFPPKFATAFKSNVLPKTNLEIFTDENRTTSSILNSFKKYENADTNDVCKILAKFPSTEVIEKMHNYEKSEKFLSKQRDSTMCAEPHSVALALDKLGLYDVIESIDFSIKNIKNDNQPIMPCLVCKQWIKSSDKGSGSGKFDNWIINLLLNPKKTEQKAATDPSSIGIKWARTHKMVVSPFDELMKAETQKK